MCDEGLSVVRLPWGACPREGEGCSLDFGFWILDFGLKYFIQTNRQSKIQNPKFHIATAAHRLGFRWRARRERKRLRQSENDDARKLAEALAATLDEATDDAETAAWIQRIEALRAALLRSEDEVTFRDYGAEGRLKAARQPDAPFRETTRAVKAIGRDAVPPHEGRLLYHLIRQFNPARCLELGTSLGLSATYQAAALATTGGTGQLITLEGGTALARRAEKHLDRLGLTGVEVVAGPFAETLPAVLQRHRPIDFAFIDGHHDPAAMRAYFEQLAPHFADGAVLVFDDIFWTTGMRHAWLALAEDPRLRQAADLLTVGICIFSTETVV